MKHSLFWAAVEAGTKAARTGCLTGFHAARAGFGSVCALVDCGIPRQHAGAQWLTDAEEDVEVWEAPLSADYADEAEPRVSLCANCGKELGDAAAVSHSVPGMFCSVRCVKATEKWLLVDEGRCGDCPLPDGEPCCPPRCDDLRCILRYGHPGAHLAAATENSRTNAGATSSRAVEEGLTEGARPPAAPFVSAAGVPTFKALEDICAKYIHQHWLNIRDNRSPYVYCTCGIELGSESQWIEHVAELQASALSYAIQEARITEAL